LIGRPSQEFTGLLEEEGIAPHIPVFDKSKRDDGTFSRSDWLADEAAAVITTT
jgi:hypothetical protein